MVVTFQAATRDGSRGYCQISRTSLGQFTDVSPRSAMALPQRGGQSEGLFLWFSPALTRHSPSPEKGVGRAKAFGQMVGCPRSPGANRNQRPQTKWVTSCVFSQPRRARCAPSEGADSSAEALAKSGTPGVTGPTRSIVYTMAANRFSGL